MRNTAIKIEPVAGPSRLEFLDGLRGIGALAVVLWHFFSDFMWALGPTPAHWTKWLIHPPFLLLTNGPFYVSVFFVLSGFVLAGSADRRNSSFTLNVITRYVRLTVPMVVSLIYAWLLALLLAFLSSSLPSLGAMGKGFLSAIWRGTVGWYWHGVTGVNDVLWTMRFELMGSIIIYAMYRFVPHGWRKKSLILFGIATIVRPYLMGFVVGALLREGWIAGRLRFGWWAWAALALSFYCACNGHFGFSTGGDEGRVGHHVFVIPLVYTLGASCLIFAVLVMEGWQRVLRTAPCQFLGRISFGLYLVHWPLLRPTERLFSLMGGPLLLRLTVLTLAFFSVAVLIGWLMTKFIDEPLVRWLGQWKKRRLVSS